MQRPTCTDIRVRSVADALIIFYAVSKGTLPIVSRRLDSEERRCIRSGSVYVWEERGPDAEATGVSLLSSPLPSVPLKFFHFKLGIERWTDGIRWGPSRVRYWRYPCRCLLDTNAGHIFKRRIFILQRERARRGTGRYRSAVSSSYLFNYMRHITLAFLVSVCTSLPVHTTDALENVSSNKRTLYM